jgi:hypothetical protein
MTHKSRHVADIKVGSVKSNSRVYPQFRLPSQYADLAGKKASLNEISEREGDVAFIIRFDQNHVAAYYERAKRVEGLKEPAEPCRGSSPSASILTFARKAKFIISLIDTQT